MTMIEKAIAAVIEKWHPGAMTASAAENGHVIVPPKLYEEAKAAVLATLETMREPTETMIDASNREWDGRMSHRSSGAWRAMIDAALNDVPQ